MRRNTILLAALPLTNAISLAVLQDINTALMPVTCLLTYDQDIPKCKITDFQAPGCSKECKAQLKQLGPAVIRACSNVIVNSNSLLGKIKSGNILGALCPSFDDTPGTTSAQKPTATQPPATVVTLPTKSPGVQITTTTRQPSYTPSPITSLSSTVEPATEPTATPTAEPTPEPTPTSVVGDTSSSLSTSAVAASSTADVKIKGADGKDTGGGSPFDISSDGSHVSRSSVLAFIVAMGAGMLIAR